MDCSAFRPSFRLILLLTQAGLEALPIDEEVAAFGRLIVLAVEVLLFLLEAKRQRDGRHPGDRR